MREGILWIDTSGMPGRVELLTAAGTLQVLPLALQQRNARDLVPAIDSMLKDAGIAPKGLKAVAVSIGPGSFTGLRVSVTTAKTLAFAGGAELHAIPTFDAWIAKQEIGETVGCVSDALKGKVYGQVFKRSESGLHPTREVRIEPDADFLAALPADSTLIGPTALLDRMGWAGEKKPIEAWLHSPWLLSLCELIDSTRYRVENLALLEPLYFRGSSAEENPKFALK